MSRIIKPDVGAELDFGHPLAHGLVGCWLMNERTGGRIFDLSGNRNHGVLTGTVSEFAWHPTGVYFDGDAQCYFTIPAIAFSSSDPWTLIIKFKNKNQDTNEGTIIGDSSAANYFWLLQGSYARFRNSAGASYEYNQYNDFAFKQTMAFVADGAGHGDIYRDGALVYSRGSVTTSMVFATIGLGYPSDVYTYGGWIDHVYIFARALSPSEIAWLHAEPYGMIHQPTLRKYWFVEAGGAIQFAGTIAIQTDVSGADLAILRQLVAVMTATTEASAIDLPVRRPLGATVAIETALSAIDLKTALEFAAQILITTATADIDLTVRRLLSARIDAATNTADITLAVLRTLAAQVDITTSTSSIDLKTALEFAAQILITTATADIDLTVRRLLSAEITASSDVSDIDLPVRRLLSAEIAAETENSDITLAVLRQLAAQAAIISATTGIDLAIAYLSVINTTIQSVTPRRTITSVTPQRTITSATPRRTIEPA